MSDQPWREEWDLQAESWVDLTTDDPFYDLLNEPTFLELVPGPGALTLDVGCGEGRMARVLSERGHRVLAVDGSPALARRAARHPSPTAVAAGDITKLPVASGVADLVVCFMVLMDVEDLDRSVAELARVLTPGGVLCAAILHPILTSGLFIPGDPNRTFSMGEYRRPMRHVLDITRPNGEVFRFRVEHRPIEDYSRAFESAGLAITALREPRPSDELVAERPEFADFQRVPDFLHVRARRDRLRLTYHGDSACGPYADGPVRTLVRRRRAKLGAVRSIGLETGPLGPAEWEPFGWIPVADTDPLDATFTYEFAWGDVHVNLISHAPDEVEHTDRGSICAVMYRHDTHTQTLMPLNVDSVLAVAPASVDFSDPAHLDTVRAFRLRPLECFALARGTWHWGPFPVGDDAVRMFNVQGKRYAEDNASVDLAARAGAVFEVLT